MLSADEWRSTIIFLLKITRLGVEIYLEGEDTTEAATIQVASHFSKTHYANIVVPSDKTV